MLMILFVFIDTASGIYVTIKINGINSFKSHKFFNVVVKLFFYLTSIIIAYIIDIHILGGVLFSVKFLLSKAITILWIYSEIKSIDENSIKLGNKPFWEQIKELIIKLKDLKKDLNDLINDKKE